MKAIVFREYGSPDVIRYEDVVKPSPGDVEVLIRVHAASVNAVDWHFMRGTPYLVRVGSGLRKPKKIQLGFDVSGRVEATGKGVTQFKPGDDVFGGCRGGSLAEYVCVAAARVIRKPQRVTFQQAAALPVATYTALQGLRNKGRVQPGQKVLINGAAGGVGTLAVQLAKSLGAEVTGVCSTGNVELVRSIGADRVIDYTRDDFTSGGPQYDVVFDCVGNRSVSECTRILFRKGTYVVAGGPDGRWLGPLLPMLKAMAYSPFATQRVVPVFARPNNDDLAVVCELVKSGKVSPVIGRCFPLSQAAEAIRHVETGHARGKVVVTMNGESQ